MTQLEEGKFYRTRDGRKVEYTLAELAYMKTAKKTYNRPDVGSGDASFDSLALDLAAHIMAIMAAEAKGGDVQRKARVQCLLIEALQTVKGLR